MLRHSGLLEGVQDWGEGSGGVGMTLSAIGFLAFPEIICGCSKTQIIAVFY